MRWLHWCHFEKLLENTDSQELSSANSLIDLDRVLEIIQFFKSFLGYKKCLLLILFFFFWLFRAIPTARGSSQARGRIRAVAAGLRRSHSLLGSKPRL